MEKTKINTNKLKKEINKFEKTGKIQMAIDTCKIAISNNENDAELHIKLGDLYMQSHLDIHQIKQTIDEAITEYQRALEACVNSSEVYFKIGMAFYYKRELEKAINYFKLAIEHNPKFAEAHYMLAEIFMKKGDLIETIDYAQNAIKISPLTSSRAYYLVYSIMSLSGKYSVLDKYLNLLSSVLTLPYDKYAMKEVVKKLSYLQFLPSLLKSSFIITFKGFTEEVLDIYRKILDKAPGYIELYTTLGRFYFELKRYDDAICEYKMAIWLDNLNVKAYMYLCELYEEQRDLEKAIDTCEKLIELQPNSASFHGKMAEYKYLSGEIEEAVEHYQTAITLSKSTKWSSAVAQTLGFIFQENMQNLDAAISSYQHAHNLNPEDIDLYLNLGNVFFEKGAYDNAVTVYKKALEASPNNARLHCNLGYLHWGKGNLEEAIKEYEKAIKLDNTYDIAYNNLGVIYLDDLGMVKKATELFEAARKYNPNYALAYYNLARSVAITGDNVEAAKLYQIAFEVNKFTNELEPSEIEEKIKDLFT